MAIIWMDGFDHYGLSGSSARMQDGVYAEAPSGADDEYSRTGAYSYSLSGGIATLATRLRRVFPQGAIEYGGVGFALFMPSLFTDDNDLRFEVRDVSNNILITIGWRTNGALLIYRGDLTELLYESPTPNFLANAWQHVEFSYRIHATEGFVEVRLNGVTIGNVSEVNTRGSFGLAAQFASRRGLGVVSADGAWMDDLFAWDTSGSFNNDFLGDRRVITIYPDADTAVAEMTVVGAAEGWQAIDDAVPDDESSYIEGATPTGSSDPVESEFDLEDVPAEVVAITAVQSYVRMRKTDAAVCNMQTSFVSGSDFDSGLDRAITEAWTYWMDVFETDPATGALWTPAALNAAKIRLARTA